MNDFNPAMIEDLAKRAYEDAWPQSLTWQQQDGFVHARWRRMVTIVLDGFLESIALGREATMQTMSDRLFELTSQAVQPHGSTPEGPQESKQS